MHEIGSLESIKEETSSEVPRYPQWNGVCENPMPQFLFFESVSLAETMKINKSSSCVYHALANEPQLATAFYELQADAKPADQKYYNALAFLHSLWMPRL